MAGTLSVVHIGLGVKSRGLKPVLVFITSLGLNVQIRNRIVRS